MGREKEFWEADKRRRLEAKAKEEKHKSMSLVYSTLFSPISIEMGFKKSNYLELSRELAYN
jgi:hypothetical protein